MRKLKELLQRCDAAMTHARAMGTAAGAKWAKKRQQLGASGAANQMLQCGRKDAGRSNSAALNANMYTRVALRSFCSVASLILRIPYRHSLNGLSSFGLRRWCLALPGLSLVFIIEHSAMISISLFILIFVR